MRKSNYDKFPTNLITKDESGAVEGWEKIAEKLKESVSMRQKEKTILVVECYPGVNENKIIAQLTKELNPKLVIESANALLAKDQLNNLIAPYLGGTDPVFGFLCDKSLPEFFDSGKVRHFQNAIKEATSGIVLVVGRGAAHITNGDILVFADLARWEIQQRFRRGESGHYGELESDNSIAAKYKRAYFVDWRVADRWKASLIEKWDFLLDTNDPQNPKLVLGDSIRQGLTALTKRPFRVVPFFDPAPWGGQWMKEYCDLNRSSVNYGWCFDCVPEENSLLLQFGNVVIELPALDLILYQPMAVLGQDVYKRFGAEFPIRFDFLDTMGGGNLSFQVHPMVEYIQAHFGMAYTQDESYYLLDAGDEACVYLGLKQNVDPQQMIVDLERAQTEGSSFPIEKYANQWPAKKHDHFLIPAGTVHCSGADSMVLEISATPYIFTFKLWDWNRMGLDGKPRPIHLKHGIANIQWDRTTDKVQKRFMGRATKIAEGDGWSEEFTGLHELEFIETRRHWFTEAVNHNTKGTLNVLNLVEGDEILVQSPDGKFEDFVVHYAETFIVPASVGAYCISPHGSMKSPKYATIKAFVRPQAP